MIALPLLSIALLSASATSAEPSQGEPAWLEELGFDARAWRKIERLSPLGPAPPDPTNRVADDPRAQRLGQALFFDAGLSRDGTISCATCHDPERSFEDGLAVPNTLGEGHRRTPTLLGAAHARWFFWDGRADSLWAQALEPIENPIEMGSSRLEVAHHLVKSPELRQAYEALFGPLPDMMDESRFPARGRPLPAPTGQPEPPEARAWTSMPPQDRQAINLVFANVGKAIAAYERLLIPGPAPFDRFVQAVQQGERAAAEDALDEGARRGLALFVGRGGCIVCHDGPAFSDSEFHNTGIAPRPGPGELDSGRYGGLERLLANPFRSSGVFSDDPQGAAARRVQSLVTSSESWGEFKTPTLRGVAERGPFMHAGQLASLEEVLQFYSTLEGSDGRSHHQEQILVALRLEPGQISDLLAFLNSLSGAPLDPLLLRAPASALLGNEKQDCGADDAAGGR